MVDFYLHLNAQNIVGNDKTTKGRDKHVNPPKIHGSWIFTAC